MTLPANGTPLLQIDGLKKYFPQRRGFLQKIAGWVKAVDGVDLRIPAGRTLGLVGESGCGKSTLARLILKLLPADAGRILYRGTDLGPLTQREMKPLRREIQIVFQDPFGSLNPRMTVGQAVSEGLRVRGVPRGPRRDDRLAQLLMMVGLTPESAGRFPHEFSGGQRQRVGIARALSVDPALIVCDEPISALDVSIQAQIINLLKDLQERLGLSYLFISHDLNVVGYLCHAVAVMYKGHIMEYGPTEALFDNPRHPYTLTLLSAIPDLKRRERRVFVSASAEELPEPSAGCKFAPLCRFAAPRCAQGTIEFETAGPEHHVRCWRKDIA